MMPLISIFNRYLPLIFPYVESMSSISETLSKIIVLISGCVVIMQIFTNIWGKKWEKEGVTLYEIYDINVFDLFNNKSIMISISHQNMLNYAKKLKKKDRLKNPYFTTPEEANDKYAHFNAIKKCFENDYFYMVEYKNFLMTIGFGFVTILLLFAFAINPTWTESIMYIFIPSLSAIGLMAQTWNDYKLKIKFLENALQVTNEYGAKKDNAYNIEGPSSRIAMRSLQDAIFLHRLNDFNIPKFLIKKYQKRKLKEIGITQTNIALKKEANQVLASVSDKATDKVAVKVVEKNAKIIVPVKEQSPKALISKEKEASTTKETKLAVKKENTNIALKEKISKKVQEVKKTEQKSACKNLISKNQSENKTSQKKQSDVLSKEGQKNTSQKKEVNKKEVKSEVKTQKAKNDIANPDLKLAPKAKVAKIPDLKPAPKAKVVKTIEEKHADRIAVSIAKPKINKDGATVKIQSKKSKVATLENSFNKEKKTPEPKAITKTATK